VACIGFAFDTYELLVLTLTVQPALTEFLTAKPGSAEFNRWIGLMFYVPAIAGGIFGLLGGYLIDLFGRRRVLFWSILLFCFSALATGYSSTAMQLLVYRCITFVGVSVEFVAATAWLAELFPERDQRESILGFTQVFASTGGILMSGASYLSLPLAACSPPFTAATKPGVIRSCGEFFLRFRFSSSARFCPNRPSGKRRGRRAPSSGLASWNYSTRNFARRLS